MALAADVECTVCGRDHAADATKCENCGNLDLRPLTI